MEHSTLSGMSLSNPSPQSSGTSHPLLLHSHRRGGGKSVRARGDEEHQEKKVLQINMSKAHMNSQRLEHRSALGPLHAYIYIYWLLGECFDGIPECKNVSRSLNLAPSLGLSSFCWFDLSNFSVIHFVLSDYILFLFCFVLFK